MHIVLGILRIFLARAFLAFYRATRWEFMGRKVIRICCDAYMAGNGIDDAAMEVITELGADGRRLLKAEAERCGNESMAAHLWSILQQLT